MSLPQDPVSEVKTIVIMVICLIVLGVIAYLAYTKSLLETQVADQAAEILQYKEANADWKTQTDAANAALKKTQDDAKARSDAAMKAIAAAQAIATTYYQQAQTVMAQKPAANDDCSAAKAVTDKFFGGKK